MKAIDKLIDTIEATGGVLRFPDGCCAPAGDPEWIDLGDVYIAACEERGRVPMIQDAGEDDIL